MSSAERLGQYEVLEVLGHGAMGLVHRAHDPRLGRDVALKIVHPTRLAKDAANARARLLLEARALAAVSHPNVLAVYDVGEEGGVVYVAMELVEGEDLAQWLRRHRPTPAQIVAMFVEAAAGLAAVHRAGLVHRDIKPANILVERAAAGPGRVRIADFGIARGGGSGASPSIDGQPLVPAPVEGDAVLTEEGKVVGTPVYMAPEQHLGREVGPAADQYALCVALFEALYGVRPFVAESRRLLSAKLHPRRQPPPSAVPSWIWPIVFRGLQPDPDERFPSMDALRAALLRAPTRSTRGWAIGIAAATIGVASFAVLATRERPCAAAEQHIAELWNDGARRAIASAFAESGRSYAQDTWTRVSEQIDAYADAWIAMHRDACEATRVRGEQSEAALDLRMACLAGRRDRLARALAVLAEGGAETVDHATAVASALEPIAPCADAEALASGIAPPATAALADAVAEVRRELADADARQTAGRYADAATSALQALAEARALDYPPVLVEALTLAGECRERLGAIDEARALLDEGIALGEAEGHDEPLARLVALRAWVAGEDDRDVHATEQWVARGRAVLQRVGQPPRLALLVENALGAAYANAGRHEDALRQYRYALAGIDGRSDFELEAAAVHQNIGNVLREQGELAAAQASFEHAGTLLSTRLGAEHPSVARIEVRVGQLLDLRGRSAEGIAMLRRAVASLEQTSDPSTALAAALLDLAAALRHLDDDEAANLAQQRALATFEAAGDELGLAFARLAFAESCLDQGVYDAAESQLERALAAFERLAGPEHPAVGYARVGIGDLRLAQGRSADALAAYERARVIGDGDPRLAMVAEIGIATVHQRERRFDAALAALDRVDERMALVPEVRLDDRLVAATVRAQVVVEAGRTATATAALDRLARTLDEARAADVTRQRTGEAALALGRARLARGELAAARVLLREAIAALAESRSAELLPVARSALAECDVQR